MVVEGADDTFEVTTGFAELISLVVTANERGRGVGKLFMRVTEELARSRGIDTLKVAVMAGNEGAGEFYKGAGLTLGELVLCRRLVEP